MEKTIQRQLKARGFEGRIVSIKRLEDLREGITRFRESGFFDEAFYQERLAGFVFDPPERFPAARSIIIVARRDPPIRFSFRWEGEVKRIIVPPTFLKWQEKDQETLGFLADLVKPFAARVVQADLPKKLLAVCSGMAVYGKNNLAYVDGMGSYCRLAVFYSDLPSDPDEWHEPRVMECCENCLICARNCPGEAINAGRFLLRAERCLTFWNEKPGTVSFPDWIEASWHHCLVGCLHCQRMCPPNREFWNLFQEGEEFTEKETRALLEQSPSAALPPTLMEKLKHWDLVDLLETLPRNLRPLLSSSRSA